MKETLVVNAFGGPGSGKSSICADIFAKLKWLDINCEMSREFAKDKVWEGSNNVLDDQLYIFGKQHHRTYILNDKVDVIISDSPLLMSITYNKEDADVFSPLVIRKFNKFNNLNFFISRRKKFNPKGRLQNLEESIALDNKIINLLDSTNTPYEIIEGNPTNADYIVEKIMEKINLK